MKYRIISYLLFLFLLQTAVFTLTGCEGRARITADSSINTSYRHGDRPLTQSTNKAVVSGYSQATSKGVLTPTNQLPVNGITTTELSSKASAKYQKIVVIDAGHQSKANNGLEPIGPGASVKKPKVSSGTRGIASGVPEYKLNLAVAKKVEKELIKRGYTVVMIRETNNVNLSNKERADIANKSGADIFIRIHADGSEDHGVTGASTLYPSKKNPYVPDLSAASYTLSKDIIDKLCKSTGAKNRGAIARDDMSGINWCKIPVSIIEMGFMSNKKEDKLMQTDAYQNKIAKGICDGIDRYFQKIS